MEECDLNSNIHALIAYTKKTYGETAASKASVFEMQNLMKMDDERGMLCKRALLLFAIANEPNVFENFKNGIDLKYRVLPFICPRFIQGNCQSVEDFVVMSSVLSEMWQGESLCNEKRTMI